MKLCGIEIVGSDARLVILDGIKTQFNQIELKVCKISLADDENSDELRAFQSSLYAFFRENNLEKISIKKRAPKGKFGGGHIGFKIECICQLYEGCPIDLISPNKIASVFKKSQVEIPRALHSYQHDAFKTAYCSLP
jgi:Protein of unknown function (DUF3010)